MLRYKPRLRAGTSVTTWKPINENKNRGFIEKASSSFTYNRVCIALIDETSSTSQAAYNANYASFRFKWPYRPLYVLRVTGGTPFYVPSNWLQSPYDFGPITVNRDNGVVANASDWFTIANLNSLPSTAKVGLFIDQSGSMTTASVQASYNLFIQKINAAGMGIITVTNTLEDYITPFINMNE